MFARLTDTHRISVKDPYNFDRGLGVDPAENHGFTEAAYFLLFVNHVVGAKRYGSLEPSSAGPFDQVSENNPMTTISSATTINAFRRHSISNLLILGMLGVPVFGFVLPDVASATPVSYGFLSSDDDGSTEVITDSMNNREWLRWDVLADLDYAETIAEITTGSRAGQGWQIAHNDDAQMFVDALFDPAACSTSNALEDACNVLPLTENLTPLLGDNYGSANDTAWYLNDNDITRPVGYLDYRAFASSFVDFDRWNTIGVSDNYSVSGGYPSHQRVSWLVYRDVTPVPLPAAFPLLLTALASLGFAKWRRSRQAARM